MQCFRISFIRKILLTVTNVSNIVNNSMTHRWLNGNQLQDNLILEYIQPHNKFKHLKFLQILCQVF